MTMVLCPDKFLVLVTVLIAMNKQDENQFMREKIYSGSQFMETQSTVVAGVVAGTACGCGYGSLLTIPVDRVMESDQCWPSAHCFLLLLFLCCYSRTPDYRMVLPPGRAGPPFFVRSVRQFHSFNYPYSFPEARLQGGFKSSDIYSKT